MSDQNDHGAAHTEHIVPISTYVAVFIALLVGTFATTEVAKHDLGEWNTVVALLIAFTKMILVVLFFMHVKYATGLTRVIIIAGFFWLGIMITLSCSDELTRGWEIVPQGWLPTTNMIIPMISRLF
jgi:cytochrome c oxidase subunit IV